MDPTLSTESQRDDLFHIKAQSDIFDISSLEKIITLVLTGYKQCGNLSTITIMKFWGDIGTSVPHQKFWGDRPTCPPPKFPPVL
jgi:hypothetical protein